MQYAQQSYFFDILLDFLIPRDKISQRRMLCLENVGISDIFQNNAQPSPH